MNEPGPFSIKLFSHEFLDAGSNYKVSIFTNSRDVIWANGPVSSKTYPDFEIFTFIMLLYLLVGERGVDDNGYVHPSCTTPRKVPTA